jgi:hypothetical protein
MKKAGSARFFSEVVALVPSRNQDMPDLTSAG